LFLLLLLLLPFLFLLSRLQLAQSREESFKTIRAHEQQLEVARKELKLAQKEAAQRVAKFSEHGRAMAGDIERLTAKQVELVSHLEQREAELKDSTTNNKALHAKINDVKALRSEVANDLKQVAQTSVKRPSLAVPTLPVLLAVGMTPRDSNKLSLVVLVSLVN
jgi:TolA-binding protein